MSVQGGWVLSQEIRCEGGNMAIEQTDHHKHPTEDSSRRTLVLQQLF